MLHALEHNEIPAEKVLLHNTDAANTLLKSRYAFFRVGPKSFADYVNLNQIINNKELTNVLTSFDKCLTYDLLHSEKIPMPRTILMQKGGKHDAPFDFPLILKIPCGNQGLGVELIKTYDEYNRILAEMFVHNDRVLCQEFIAESQGSDKRIIVAGDEVIASMKRIAAKGDFRANLHQGGTAEKYTPTEDEKKMAISSLEILGLGYAGVDIIDSVRGPLVLEVNPSPGFGISDVVGKDVADGVIKAMKKKGVI